jgi:membrane protease YdiL (CAAX protease family)
VVGAGFGEELIWRGFLFERLGHLLRPRAGANAAMVLITAVLFGLAHYPDQGTAGVAQAAIAGLAFGTLFLATGRLWLPMIVHAAFDVTAVLMIYWNLETVVARLFFR